MAEVAPDRVATYGIENHAGTPVYVHAKTCVVDDTWATIGSDNFNRRSWTHDSELSAVVIDEKDEFARDLRLTLAAEHLDRSPEEMSDCVDPAGMFAAYADGGRRARRVARPAAGSARGRLDACAGSTRRGSGCWRAPSPCRRTSSCTTRTDGPKPLRKADGF